MTEAWRGPVRDDGKRAIYLTEGTLTWRSCRRAAGARESTTSGFKWKIWKEL